LISLRRARLVTLLKTPLKQLKNYGLTNPAGKNEMIRRGMQYQQSVAGGLLENIRRKIIPVGLVLIAAALALAAPSSRSTSDEALRARFVAHRADFERLVAMANEDKHLVRIAPDFTWLDDDVAWPRKDVGISEQRWNDYRELFQRVGTKDGIVRSEDSPGIFIPIFSQGLVPSSSEKGLVYSQTPLKPTLESLDKSPPGKLWDGPDHSHILVYRPIEDHWYIFYQQW
jgi:hypothetical protein